MLQNLLHYAPLITAAMTCVTAMIWIVYLSFFLRSYRRQQRPSILITSGAGRDLDAHCFVTNLGLEPVYLLDVVIDLIDTNGRVARAVIPERTERWNKVQPGEDDDARLATNVGPLSSGGERDLGRFRTLIERASTANPDIEAEGEFTSLEITVVIVTASQAELCGAVRCYGIERATSGQPRLKAHTIKARQLQGYFARNKLARLLSAQLDAGG
ncbi:hypothetical protein RZA67_07735 [Stenotrophomonas sp. C3(2023)]|uniref:hypothetical protein n=1 Tax=Stenotrophomonas sp. C3(2023) TaxID=3080277 RepID=UPI00293C7513|nr:hypothetical protein [Stenotrophomonas sp. C3(2023)]MDV3468619.1 hypothetical protein [Stenotrophomonas sp. C3(2023)]